MGISHSKQGHTTTAAADAKIQSKEFSKEEFSEVYALQEKLSEGIFSEIFLCTHL